MTLEEAAALARNERGLVIAAESYPLADSTGEQRTSADPAIDHGEGRAHANQDHHDRLPADDDERCSHQP